MTWLGFIWDLDSGSLVIPQEKLDGFKSDVLNITGEPVSLTPRRLAKITGKIISFQPSFGNICRIMSRNMLMQITTSHYWDGKLILSRKSETEVNFWLENCDHLPAKKLFSKIFLPERIVYTDASNFACAGFSVSISNTVVHKMWSTEEATKSSTFRELKAVSITLHSLLHLLHHRLVKIFY